ncbi:hypothetical protein ACTA71_004579 [Dictyostelium dimigraforme]
MATLGDTPRIPHYFIPQSTNNEEHLLSNSNNINEDIQNHFNNIINNIQNKKKKKTKVILKIIKKYIIFIPITLLFLFLLFSRKQLLKEIEDQKYQYEQLLENQKQNQKQNKDLSNILETYQTILEQNKDQYKDLSNKFEIHQTILEQYETDFKINYFVNKVIDIQAIDVGLFFRTDGSVLNLTKFPNEWEKFIIEQSKIPGRYFIKSNHFKTFLFYNNGTNTLSMTQHLMDSECSTFKFIKTNINDQYQIETCLGFLIKSTNGNQITIKKENSDIVGTIFILNIV